MDPSSEWVNKATQILIDIGRSVIPFLKNPDDRLTPIVKSLESMERAPEFNAGYGSALQSDGQARVSAAVMDGVTQSFSGVIGATNLMHPSRLARHLQGASSRVLTYPGCELLARELQQPVASLVTPKRLAQWFQKIPSPESSCDTVGAVFYHPQCGLAAGTSTGGRGFEFPGRVTDSVTVAGNYASHYAAISATGIGEEIVDDALAARMETRYRDGMSLFEASNRCFQEATSRRRSYGWISLSHKGEWVIAHTTPVMTYLLIDEDGNIIISS
jgi:L-asparaginase